MAAAGAGARRPVGGETIEDAVRRPGSGAADSLVSGESTCGVPIDLSGAFFFFEVDVVVVVVVFAAAVEDEEVAAAATAGASAGTPSQSASSVPHTAHVAETLNERARSLSARHPKMLITIFFSKRETAHGVPAVQRLQLQFGMSPGSPRARSAAASRAASVVSAYAAAAGATAARARFFLS